MCDLFVAYTYSPYTERDENRDLVADPKIEYNNLVALRLDHVLKVSTLQWEICDNIGWSGELTLWKFAI